MADRDTDCALVVVNYGSHDLVRQNVSASLAGTTAQVVVVDSYSTAVERSRMAVVAADHAWDLVLPNHNVGFGGGVNLGVNRALDLGAERVVVLNPDARLDPGSFDALTDRVAREPLALVAPPIFRPDGAVYSRGLTYLDEATGLMSSRQPAGPSRAWLSGACLALSRELWTATGGMAEDYFLYWEDVDFCARVIEVGGTLAVADDARAVHDEGATHRETQSSSRAKSGIYYYYNIRNRLLYASRRMPADAEHRWRRSSVQAARAIVLQGGRRQLLHSREPWTSAWRGVRDGLRGMSGPA